LEDREIIVIEKLCENAACNIKFLYYPRSLGMFRNNREDLETCTFCYRSLFRRESSAKCRR